MSGYAPKSDVDLGETVTEFVTKPFRPRELLEKVRALVDRASLATPRRSEPS
jgi:DNA-binding response OmpR family regulator